MFRDVLARVADEQDVDADLRDAVDHFRAALDVEQSSNDVPAVFAGAVRLLRTSAAERPTLLVLEDLHVADRDSLALVTPLVRLADVPVLTVATLRPSTTAGDVEHLFEQMSADGRGAIVDLEALDRHETQALVAGVIGAAPDEPLTDAVYATTQGNPFFAREVAQSLADAGEVTIDGGRAHLVAGAPAVALRPSTALLRRLLGGTSADVELAKVMAVFGRFSLRQLPLVQRLTEQPEARSAVHSTGW